MHRHVRLVTQALVDSVEQRAATGQHDATVHDVAGKFGRCLVKRELDCFHDLVKRLGKCLAHFLAGQDQCLGQARDQVAAADLGTGFLLQGEGQSQSRA